MNTHTIGIDFGTTKTLVAWSNPNTGRTECLRLGRERDYMPTTIAIRNKGGELLFGDEADDALEYAEYTYISGFKMKLGSSSSLCMYLGKDNRLHHLTALDLTREFLKHVRQKVEAECLMQGQVGKAVITYPIKFGPAQIDELQRAAEAAGFPHVELQYEPEAAGYAFCSLCPAEAFRNRALIVDWGGGTLDISLITREGESFDTHREISDGDMQMGGEIFDDRLWADVNERMKAKGVTFTPVDARRMRPKVRQGKEHLSSAEIHALSLSRVGEKAVSLPLTRADFNKLIADSVSKAVDKVQNIIAKAAADQKPEMLLLVGGSSRIPLIKEKLEAACSLPACKWQYSREAIALGAALIAAYDRQDSFAASDAVPEQQTEPGAQTPPMSADELNNLGMRYWDGDGQPQDFVQAASFFFQAAQQGHREAQYNLAQCYRQGKGVPKDDQQALHWFQLAAANGHKGAKDILHQYNEERETNVPPSRRGKCAQSSHGTANIESHADSAGSSSFQEETFGRSNCSRHFLWRSHCIGSHLRHYKQFRGYYRVDFQRALAHVPSRFWDSRFVQGTIFGEIRSSPPSRCGQTSLFRKQSPSTRIKHAPPPTFHVELPHCELGALARLAGRLHD